MNIYEERDLLAAALRRIAVGDLDNGNGMWQDCGTELQVATQVARDALESCNLTIEEKEES